MKKQILVQVKEEHMLRIIFEASEEAEDWEEEKERTDCWPNMRSQIFWLKLTTKVKEVPTNTEAYIRGQRGG
jgi:hypothetical protein